MRETKFMKLVAVSVAAALVMGCAASTVIKSNPTGAEVYLDGVKVGKTPYTMTDTKMVFQSTTVRLKKEGYEDVTTVISRAEEIDPLPAIGGLCVGIPWLWAMKYRPEHSYELERRR